MTWKSILSAAAVAVTSASIAVAQPTIEVAAVENGGNLDWTIGFTPDGGSGSLGIELALEIVGDIVAAPAVTADYSETLGGTPIVNPGNDPFAGAVTEGVTLYEGVTSVVSSNPGVGVDTVDGFFAALGSTAFSGTTGSQDALTFTTVGTTGTVYWDVLIEQGGGANDGGFTVTEAGSEEAGGVALLFGDATNDGFVNGADVLEVETRFGDTGLADGLLLGDANDDGFVNGADVLVVETEFGATLGAVAGSAVPEPGMLALAGIAAFGLLGVRGRKA